MGRCNYSAVGYGMTEEEARRYALDSDREFNGHQEGYSGSMCSSTHEDDKSKCLVKPVPAKRCKVEKQVQKGTRKWETVYSFVVANNYSRSFSPLSNSTQGDAIKEAKRLSLKHNCQVEVRMEKLLVGRENKIAIIQPSKVIVGKWLFTGTAREQKLELDIS